VGRIGTRGREKTEYFDGEAEAISASSKLAARKLRRGYVGSDNEIATGNTS
jgi:predicted DNA-binding WGR domain protein